MQIKANKRGIINDITKCRLYAYIFLFTEFTEFSFIYSIPENPSFRTYFSARPSNIDKNDCTLYVGHVNKNNFLNDINKNILRKRFFLLILPSHYWLPLKTYKPSPSTHSSLRERESNINTGFELRRKIQ